MKKLITILLLLTCACTKSKLNNTLMEKWRVSLSDQEFFLKEITSEGNPVWGIKSDELLRIKFIASENKTQANQFVSQYRYMIESLYFNRQNPYPGDISQSIPCPKELHPVFDENPVNNQLLQIKLTTNNRFIPGVCNEALASYKAITTFYFCETLPALFEVTLFRPLHSNTSTPSLPELQCPQAR